MSEIKDCSLFVCESKIENTRCLIMTNQAIEGIINKLIKQGYLVDKTGCVCIDSNIPFSIAIKRHKRYLKSFSENSPEIKYLTLFDFYPNANL